ncbi:MAG: glycosyl hydrolase family 28 protein [Fimbriimonadales bacterium]|nr:glycosyl hydrolase family 28 protein [Fimbriimonadales bacterium]
MHVGGGGVLDGGWGEIEADWGRMAIFDRCTHATISDLTVVRPRTWMVTVGGCEDAEVRNLHEIGACVGSDGVDIVGCRRVRVRGGLLRNNDDCVAIKAFHTQMAGEGWFDWSQDVRDVVVEDLAVANDSAGNALEIGHELRTDSVSDVVFRNLDILHVHGHGAPFSINCGDRATVRDVLFEDIRVEHHYDKLLNLRVMRSRFNQDEERGCIRGVTFRNVRVQQEAYNPGYTVSLIGGWDERHRVEDVLFEDFLLGGRKATSLQDLEAYTRHVGSIRFR